LETFFLSFLQAWGMPFFGAGGGEISQRWNFEVNTTVMEVHTMGCSHVWTCMCLLCLYRLKSGSVWGSGCLEGVAQYGMKKRLVCVWRCRACASGACVGVVEGCHQLAPGHLGLGCLCFLVKGWFSAETNQQNMHRMREKSGHKEDVCGPSGHA